LELTEADPGNTFDLAINPDSDAARSALQGFVTAYNGALNALRTVSAYNAETRTAAALNGDATVRSLASQLRGAVGDAFESLSALGIKSSKDGSLSLDTAKLDAALADNPAAVADAFDKDITSTLGANLTERLDAALNGSDGSLNARTKSLDARLKLLATDRERLDVRMERVEEGYRRQFTALDGLVAQLQGTSSFLQQQLAGLL
jgi:flagellar hook-associated protein 2